MKENEESDVWRPDVYICNNCNHRFAKAEYIKKEEDGLIFERTVCPKCKSEDIRISSWREKDHKRQ
ncbi:MAG: hypothetical protein U9O98_07735 [Asgard group archaeon]|nr:hypothetical protein [Asgard group archaeon]